MLTCKTEILIDNGTIKINGCKSFSIQTDVDNLTNKGEVVLPLRWQYKGDYLKEILKEGQTIEIKAGYLECGLNDVFYGYIKGVQKSEELKLEIEDAVYLLRKKPISISIEKTTIKAICQKIVEGTEVTLSDKIVKMEVEKFNYVGNSAGALQTIKDDLHLTCYITKEKKLYVGLEQLEDWKDKYQITAEYGRNIIKNDLEYKSKEAFPLKVVAKGARVNGKNIEVTAGIDGGDKHSIINLNIKKEADLKVIAEEYYNRHSFDGFTGTLTMFFIPFAIAGGSITYINKNYTESKGKYFIKAVQYEFSEQGMRQIIKPSTKL